METQHAVFGTAWAMSNHLNSVGFAINGHHSGLHDFSSLKEALANPELAPRTHADTLMSHLVADLINQDLPPLTPIPEWWQPTRRTFARFSDDLRIRMLFSCLIDADRLDSEKHTTGRERIANPLDAKALFERLDNFVRAKSTGATVTEVNRIRREVYRACIQTAEHPRGCFSLTAPTGSGKTLASMAFALKHAHAQKLRRVIVVLPFLAIIEQNAAVYRQALLNEDDRETILEHHSASVEPDSSTPASENDDQIASRVRARQATENWDAPIIVTTAVQFLESLFARSPSQCRKLHNIAQSVVVFDEVQTLPFDLLDPIMSVVKDLCDDFGVSFLFSSATVPKFEKPTLTQGFGPNECREILTETTKTFKVLRRATLELPFLTEAAWSWETLAERLEGVDRALIIVNLRKHAQNLHDVLKRRNLPVLFHLSATMCSAHRRKKLGNKEKPETGSIYGALASNGPCIVVSTQVVEAGVDIDFPVVFRAIAPLDAIIQAAGRCDREGSLSLAAGRPAGRFIVFEPSEQGMPGTAYESGANEARRVLDRLGDNPERLLDDPSVFAEYHQTLLQLGQGRQTGAEIQKARNNLNFEQVDEMFEIMDRGGQSVVVPYGDSEKLLDDIRSKGHITREDRRRLQQYMVTVYMSSMAKLAGLAQPVIPGDESLLELTGGSARYRDEIGLLLGEMPVEDFIV
jgi:CRISPR-associated endonuclease/helicase Cas3